MNKDFLERIELIMGCSAVLGQEVLINASCYFNLLLLALLSLLLSLLLYVADRLGFGFRIYYFMAV